VIVRLEDVEAGEERDVLAVLAQRRSADAAHVEAVQEVGAEAAGAYLGREVAVGGREDAHVHVRGPVGADRLDLALLQHAQELGLHVQRQLADLVQEQARPVGHAELARARAGRAGEGALLVAEELALDHRLRQRGAVQVDQRLLRAARGGVQGAHDELVAAGGLTQPSGARGAAAGCDAPELVEVAMRATRGP
jgi:hypothetical protein